MASVLITIAMAVPGCINNCCVSHAGCALEESAVSGGWSGTGETFVLGYCLWKDARTSTGCECHGTTFCLSENMLRMKRSLNDTSSNKLPAKLRGIPKKEIESLDQVFGREAV